MKSSDLKIQKKLSLAIENHKNKKIQLAESILEDILSDIIKNLKKYKVVKISNFGTFHVRFKKKRIGRNPRTKEEKIIKERNVVLFKPSKDFKEFINNKNEKNL